MSMSNIMNFVVMLIVVVAGCMIADWLKTRMAK